MPSQLATTVSDQNDSFLDILVHDFLPVFALAAGLMALIMIACAAMMISGYLIGAAVVFGVRALVDACVRYVRHRREVEYAQLATVDADSAYTKVVNLDRYRRRRQHRRPDNVQTDDPFRHCCDDDPA